MTKYDDYVSAGDKKIEELKRKLLTAKQDGIDVEERKKWRCKVSAHQNRMKKRKEIEVLNAIVKKKDDRAMILCEEILVKRLKQHPDVLEKIVEDIFSYEGKQAKLEGKTEIRNCLKSAFENYFITKDSELE